MTPAWVRAAALIQASSVPGRPTALATVARKSPKEKGGVGLTVRKAPVAPPCASSMMKAARSLASMTWKGLPAGPGAGPGHPPRSARPTR